MLGLYLIKYLMTRLPKVVEGTLTKVHSKLFIIFFSLYISVFAHSLDRLGGFGAALLLDVATEDGSF